MSTPKAPEKWLKAEGRLAVRASRACAAALGLVLLPKCPLCIAAYLVSFGLGTSAAAFAAPLIRPLALMLAASALLALFAGLWRKKAQPEKSASAASASCCCD